MWPVVWTAMRTYAPYVTFPVAFVVGAVGYHLEWFIRGTPNAREDEKGVQELVTVDVLILVKRKQRRGSLGSNLSRRGAIV